MGQIVLLVLAGVVLVAAALFSWILLVVGRRTDGRDWPTPATVPDPRAGFAAEPVGASYADHERIVREACADLDAEYRMLLGR